MEDTLEEFLLRRSRTIVRAPGRGKQGMELARGIEHYRRNIEDREKMLTDLERLRRMLWMDGGIS